MSKVELSVIIPAYNAESFIGRAINSVLQQDLEKDKLEIIIVENGSVDKTTSIVEEIAKRENCVKLYHSSKGVSNARNKGIEESSGRWLMFLDADDILVDGVVSKELVSINETDVDIFFYGHRAAGGNRYVCDNGVEELFVGNEIEELKVRILKNPTRYMQSIAKIYNRRFLVENLLEFNSELRLSEDSEFLFRCLQVAKSVQLKNTIIYEAIPNTASATRLFDGNKVNDYIFALKETYENVANESDDVKNAFIFYILMHMNIAMVREVFSINNKSKLGEKYKKMCEVANQPIFKEAISATKIRECLSLRMAPILCMKIKCRPLAAGVYIIRALQNYMRER